MISHQDKFVLVRPQGGLNDTLKQIETCCQYAEFTGRKVVVDTKYTGSSTFHDNFSNYFVSRQRGLILDTFELDLENFTDVFPTFLSGRLMEYRTNQKPVNGFYRDLENGEPITFDFQKNYPERVVVHHQLGGGDSSPFFHRAVLSQRLCEDLSARLKRLAPHYFGIHIRNTDYESDFQAFIKDLTARKYFLNRRVFLATDSEDALQYFKENVTDALYVELTQADVKGNQPLHTRNVDDPHYWTKSNSEAILDLLTLAYSNKILAAPLENFTLITGKNFNKIMYSGFVQLAMRLQSNRPLLTRFTGISGWLDL